MSALPCVHSVEDSFVLATEYSQRVIAEIANTDREQLNDVASLIRNMSEIVSRANRVFSSGPAFMEAYDTPVPIIGYNNVFEPQVTYLATLRNAISANAEEMYSSLAVEEETIWQLKLFLELPSEQWKTRLHCSESVTPQAFNLSFNPLHYYEQNFGIWAYYGYAQDSRFSSLSDMYAHYSANCANYFDTETTTSQFEVNYHTLFACQSYLTDCDFYLATKRLHAVYLLRHFSAFLLNQVPEAQRSLTRAYFNFINVTFDGGYGRAAVDDLVKHRACVENLASYTSDLKQLLAETCESVHILCAFKQGFEQNNEHISFVM